jgi:hypothetical protein
MLLMGFAASASIRMKGSQTTKKMKTVQNLKMKAGMMRVV